MYITVMFPYPSGSGLHIGHWYNYSVVDSYCRIMSYLGHNVFQPFGYDSFGLPAENYAKKVGRDPKEVTEENITNFSKEMERMNTNFEYHFSTHSEQYQIKTQDLFLKLYNKGLAYKADREQEYCPSCQTTLAREQVKEGKCERCKTEVIKKKLNQWFFKITDYKDRLIKDLNKVDYPKSTKEQQIHWLNKLTDWCVSRQRSWGCPIPIEGENETLDTFVDSSFYCIEYDRSRPVDVYVGGSEHACMHLIYARFITKFLYDIGEIDFDEPFLKVVHQGMILGPDGNKMSKSLGNTIDPAIYDPHILRMYLMFINHYFEGGKWIDNGYKGCEKFDKRFKEWVSREGQDTFDFQTFEEKIINLVKAWKFNKVVSEFMILYNSNKHKSLDKDTKGKLIKLYYTVFP